MPSLSKALLKVEQTAKNVFNPKQKGGFNPYDAPKIVATAPSVESCDAITIVHGPYGPLRRLRARFKSNHPKVEAGMFDWADSADFHLRVHGRFPLRNLTMHTFQLEKPRFVHRVERSKLVGAIQPPAKPTWSGSAVEVGSDKQHETRKSDPKEDVAGDDSASVVSTFSQNGDSASSLFERASCSSRRQSQVFERSEPLAALDHSSSW